MLRRLAPADYVTLAGLGVGWTAASLFLFERPDVATLTLLVAFLLDKADGLVARRGYGSPLGHQLDALADVVIYLVPSAIIVADLAAGVAAGPVVGSLAGSVVLCFGVLRLARYTIDGRAAASAVTTPEITDGGVADSGVADSEVTDRIASYRGLTAFHVAAWALIVRLAVDLFGVRPLIGAVGIVAVTPLMIAPFRIDATRRQFLGAVVVGSAITAGTLV